MGSIGMITQHGGPDGTDGVRWDFSTNSHGAGPCSAAWAAVQAADATCYPNYHGQALREQLAAWHGVYPDRILLAASASEFIQRITAVSGRLLPGPVALPELAYGDYARAALACGRTTVSVEAPLATLRWLCDPSSPVGQAQSLPAQLEGVATVLDAVYAPLRLAPPEPWGGVELEQVFVLHSPNKALGLTGVRAAYAVAPAAACWQPWLQALQLAAPSWPLGAQGQALLQAWTTPAVQDWLYQSLGLLREWKQRLLSLLTQRGVLSLPSITPFFCAQLGAQLPALRAQGLQLRDTTSFGLPGWARLNTLRPEAQDCLMQALDRGSLR
jgi:histidinol-phosphate aminotransferase